MMVNNVELSVIKKNRNHNLIEMIIAYNSLIDSLNQNQDTIIKEDFYHQKPDFLGYELVDFLEEDLFYSDLDNVNNLSLFMGNRESGISLIDHKKIILEPNYEEITYLKYLLDSGDLDLFINETLKSKIQDNIAKHFENANMEYFDFSKLIVVKGESIEADNLNCLRNEYKLVEQCINSNHQISFIYDLNENYIPYMVTPISFVFSQLDKRLRVFAYNSEVGFKRYYLSNMSNLIDSTINGENYNIVSETKEIVIECANDSNVLERIAARFASYKKDIKLLENGNYQVTIFYYVYEESRIKIRILSLGSRIKIKSTESKEKIREIAKKALENYY